MLKKGIFILFIMLILVMPLCSAVTTSTTERSISSYMGDVGSYVNKYNSGTIDAAKLIVYLEYVKSKMYESLDKQNKKAFTEEEIKNIFEEKENEENKQMKGFSGPMDMYNPYFESQFEKVFSTNDFEVVFTANPFYRYDKEYYEKREEEAEKYYVVGYYLRTIKEGEDILIIKSEIKSFLAELKTTVNKNEADIEGLRGKFSKVKQKMWEIEKDDCKTIMKAVGMTEREKDEYMKQQGEEIFSFKIKEVKEKNCWMDQKCNWYCEPTEDCWKDCYPKTICEEITNCTPECHEEEYCDEICENVTIENTTTINCSQICKMQEVCTTCTGGGGACWEERVCEEVCNPGENCYNKCEDFEKCEEYINGEMFVEGICREDSSDINVNAYGPGLDHYQMLNNMGERGWGCEAQIKGLVKQRKAFQKSVNNNFAKWYFEDFIGDDPEKMINGGNGFKRVLEILKSNEEEIANNFHCSESSVWPEGFEKIDVTYKNNNTHVEIWEKRIPVEWSQNTLYWTTLYKYSWVPGKDLLKELISYKISELDTFGPTSKDAAEIKSDEGKMEIVNILSEKYGGSFDVKLELKDKEGSIVKKYLQVNQDVAVKVVDEISEREDISITVDYDVLYNFINYLSYTMEGDKIRGPYWVRIQGEEGPGKFFSVIGAISKMWREGVKIKPRYALLKLVFNFKNIITLMMEADSSSGYEGKTVKVENPEMVKEEY